MKKEYEPTLSHVIPFSFGCLVINRKSVVSIAENKCQCDLNEEPRAEK